MPPSTKVMQFVAMTQTYRVHYRLKDEPEKLREVTLAGVGLVDRHWVTMYIDESCQLAVLEAAKIEVEEVLVDGCTQGRRPDEKSPSQG